MREKLNTRMINGLITIAIFYVTILVVMFVFQRQLMYFPDKNVGEPKQYGLSGFGEYFTATSDGVNIQLWYKPAKPGMPTVAYFHGNASHIGNRAGIYSALANKGFGVLATSYRGYGKSEGIPGEQGLYNDGRTALTYLTKEKHIPPANIIIYGESLGTGVSVQMASEHKVGALVLQAPYTSVVNRAAEMYFYLPVRLLIRDHYDSIGKIKNVHSPLMIFHGELDTTIPITHGRALFDAANQPKEAVYFADVGHNNFDSAVIAENLLAFAKAQGLIK